VNQNGAARIGVLEGQRVSKEIQKKKENSVDTAEREDNMES